MKEIETSVDVVKRMQLPSVSSALLLASGIGILEAVALYYGAGSFINLMGVSSVRSGRKAFKYLIYVPSALMNFCLSYTIFTYYQQYFVLA